ncbi:hypothetical protein MMC07_007437 [Pseudocyphellaria aurata]|nr:hypothetical protein [Pseudocyphellaria aurata]
MSYYYKYVPHYSGEVNKPPEEPKAPNPWLAPAPAPAPAYVACQAAPAQCYYQIQAQPVYYAAAPVPEPVKHNFWYGSTKVEVDAQNAAIAQASGATKPVQLIPQGGTPSSQYYCRELDGSYTLRTVTEIMETLQPGHWQYANPGGYPYWIRTKAA